MNLLQVVEIIMHNGAEILLLGIAVFIFLKISRVAGILLALSSFCALLMQLSFQNVFGLGFLAEILLSESQESGELLPTISASMLGITMGISKMFLVVSVFMLSRRALVVKKGAGNVS
jgi:hypothetical protein